jgi:hypothetical protein
MCLHSRAPGHPLLPEFLHSWNLTHCFRDSKFARLKASVGFQLPVLLTDSIALSDHLFIRQHHQCHQVICIQSLRSIVALCIPVLQIPGPKMFHSTYSSPTTTHAATGVPSLQVSVLWLTWTSVLCPSLHPSASNSTSVVDHQVFA